MEVSLSFRYRPLRALLLAGFLSSAIVPSGAQAAAPPPIPKLTADAVTHHTLQLNGRTYAYTARAGTITLRNETDQPTARVFYTAFTLDGSESTHRPVTFLYNGGPGSSTIWLRMGSFAPMRVQTADGTTTPGPPFTLSPNKFSLIDKTDLVFIDMPGSGYGRIIGAGTPKDFWGVDQDANAFAQFIQRYVTNFNRWNSPKFLFGESYGTTRSAVLSNILAQKGIALNGIVLLSSFLNPMVDYNDGAPIGGGDWAYVLYLPTETATAWYHGALGRGVPLNSLLSEVKSFALGEYLDGLAQGTRLDQGRFNDIVAKLHRYTGLSEQYIRNSNLRIPYDRFENELLRSRGLTVGRLDGRFQTYVLDRPEISPDWDATDSAIDGAFIATGNYYLQQVLKYNPPLLYRSEIYDLIYSDGNSWDFKHGNNPQDFNVAPDLAQTMTLEPRMKVFSANGYFDFATPFFATQYVLSHLYLAPALQRNISYGFYESGHMVYLHPAALAKFHDDLERWYAQVLR
ncbi:MAG: peptidase S10 [Candidatus Tumulicola sp.]